MRIDRLYDTSLTLSNPTPGTYCLRINAHERCSGANVNRSTLYKKHTILPIPSTIRTIDVPDIKTGFLGGLAPPFNHYYKFTLSSQTDVTVSLFSTDFDTLLILKSHTGHKLAEDDNGHVDWGNHETDDDLGTNSEIAGELIPGTYTIEVMSTSEYAMGEYTLVIRDIGNDAIETICAKRGQRYPAVFPGPNHDRHTPNDWVAEWYYTVGDDNMVGRCGKGDLEGFVDCWNSFKYTRDCFDHDVCVGQYGQLHCRWLLINAWDDCKDGLDCGGPYHIDPYLGSCGGEIPCYSTIQEAINAASSGTTIKILRGSYDEDLSPSTSINLILEGGWDATYSSQTSTSTINSLTITDGTIIINDLVIQ